MSIENVINPERQVIGSILLRHEVIDSAIRIIPKPEIFKYPEHQIIYRAMLELYNESKPIDITILANKLGGDLDKVGGRLHLMSIQQDTGSPSNIEEYANIVVEKYRIRKIHEGCQAIIDNGFNPSADEVRSKLEDITFNIIPNEKYHIESMEKATNDLWDALLKGEDVKHYQTGLPELDREIIGLFPGNLNVIAAPPSMGKTSFALDICLHNARNGNKTLYFAIDETNMAMAQRIITNLKQVENKFYQKSILTEKEEAKIASALAEIKEMDNLQICDNAGLTILDIKAIVKQQKRQHGLDIIVIDYIQQVRGYKKYERRDLEIGDICTTLKEIGKENDITVIAISQLNRDYSNANIDPKKRHYGIPRPSQLRDSGVIEQDANLILFPHNILEAIRKKGFSRGSSLYNDEYDYILDIDKITEQRIGQGRPPLERALISIAKNKVGPTGMVKCAFDPESMKFIEIDTKLWEGVPDE